MTKRRKRRTLAEQVAHLRAENDRREARLKAEAAKQKPLDQVWREAFAPRRPAP